MLAIYSYQKVSGESFVFPKDSSGNQMGVELCTLSGTTYVSIPDGYALPAQPTGITPSQESLPLAAALHDSICEASPYVAQINQQIRAKIAQKYEISDEIRALRLGTTDAGWSTYNTYVESCHSWGASQKALLGL